MSRSFFALLLVPAGLFAQDLKPVALPRRQTSGGKPLSSPQGTAFDARIQHGKALAAGALELAVGWLGINREDGRRTRLRRRTGRKSNSTQ